MGSVEPVATSWTGRVGRRWWSARCVPQPLARLRAAWASCAARLLGAVLLLALALRLPNLTESLWFDELWSTRLLLADPYQLYRVVRFDAHPPLYSVFMFLWTGLVGDSELAIRLPSLVSGVVSVGVTYLLTRRMIWASAGLVAALMMAVSPVHIWYSQEARSYAFVVLSVLLSLYCYYRLRDAPKSRGWLVGYLLATAAAVNTHYYTIGVLGLLALLCVLRRERITRQVIVANAIAVLPVACFLAAKLRFDGIVTQASYLRPFTPYELWMLFFHWFSYGNALWSERTHASPAALFNDPVRLAVQVLIALVMLGGLVRVLQTSRYGLDVVLLLFGLPLALMAASLVAGNIYIERSLLVLLPFFLMVVAAGVTGFRHRLWTVAGSSLVMVFCLVALGAYFARLDQWTVYKPNPDWRAVAEYLDDQRVRAAGPLVAYTGDPALTLLYYRPWIIPVGMAATAPHGRIAADRERVPGEPVVELRSLGEAGDVCAELVAKQAWGMVLLFHDSALGQRDEVLARLGRSDRCWFVEQRIFKSVEVYRFGVAGAP